VLPNEDFPFNTVVCGTDCLGGRDLLQTLIATMALLFCLGTSALTAAQSLSGQPETAAAPGAEQRAGASQDAGLYLELQLAQPVKVSKLKTGDILEGRLSRGVYKGDLEVFPAGSPVRLTVGKLERRKRESTDHWPGVIELLSPRHENYPTFESASILTSGGIEVPLRVSVISISRKVRAEAKAKKPAQSVGSSQSQAEAASSGSATVPAPENNRKRHGTSPPAKPRIGQTIVLEGADSVRLPAPMPSDTPTPSLPPGPVTLPTGTQAQVVLLTSISAAKSRPGDSFRARLVEPVRLDSRVVLPEGSQFEGKVVKATPPRWLSRPGSLYLTFTGLALPGGSRGPVAATITGAEVDARSSTKLNSEGGLSGGPSGKAWMLINLGVTAGIAKVTDDTTQVIIEALVSTATDASTAGVAKIVAACASGIFLVTRHGRDVVLPRFTEMDITFSRPLLIPGSQLGSEAGRGGNRAPVRKRIWAPT